MVAINHSARSWGARGLASRGPPLVRLVLQLVSSSSCALQFGRASAGNYLQRMLQRRRNANRGMWRRGAIRRVHGPIGLRCWTALAARCGGTRALDSREPCCCVLVVRCLPVGCGGWRGSSDPRLRQKGYANRASGAGHSRMAYRPTPVGLPCRCHCRSFGVGEHSAPHVCCPRVTTRLTHTHLTSAAKASAAPSGLTAARGTAHLPTSVARRATASVVSSCWVNRRRRERQS